MTLLFLLLSLLLSLSASYAKRERFTSTKAMMSKAPKAIQEACKGNLAMAMELVKDEQTASALHVVSALAFVKHGDVDGAVYVHDMARGKDPKLVPPLAKLYLDGNACNGLGDLFYVGAVSVKKLKDDKGSDDSAFEAHTSMVTLLSDSGLYEEAENHLQKAMFIEPGRSELRMRSALMTPGVYSSKQHLLDTRELLQDRLDSLSNDTDFTLHKLNEFSLSPTFYFIYQGFSDVKLLTQLHDVYARAHPNLHSFPETIPKFPRVDSRVNEVIEDKVDEVVNDSSEQRPLRVGFVSSHFRRHSICKLFCGIITDLAETKHTSINGRNTSFQVYIFSGQDESREDAHTKKLKNAAHLFVRLSRFTVPSRQEVLKRRIDVLVYLDVGMDPSTSVWAASKLAPIQMCIWGHPSTTGLRAMDYYISSDLFHMDLSPQYQRTEETFLEQLVRLPSSLGISFQRPSLPVSVTDEDLIHRSESFLNSVETLSSTKPFNASYSPFVGPTTISTLVEHRKEGHKLILIPQHLPKFHPDFDVVMKELLEAVPNAYIVITFETKKAMWRKTLETRWSKEAALPSDMIRKRILWLESLSPSQYLAMLTLGDVMIDPFPFGGGVTTLEALSVCTPVVTLPSLQNVPALTAGMLRTLSGNAHDANTLHAKRIFTTVESFVEGARLLLTDEAASLVMRSAICRDVSKVYAPSLSADEAVAEWAEFIVTASSAGRGM